MKSMVEISHDFLSKVLHPQAIAVDATLGQGKDSRFFLGQGAREVYAFEIQPLLVEKAEREIPDSRMHVFLASHERMDELLSDKKGRVDAVVFNFGWDPAQNGGITTIPEVSVQAVKKAYELLKNKGRMALVFYPHKTGKIEKAEILKSLSEMDACEILLLENPGRFNSPSLALVEKRHSRS